MQYFRYFPTIEYKNNVITDIFIKHRIAEYLKNNRYLFFEYEISDFEKPEDVSLKFYKSMNFAWLILLANDIIDPIKEWYLPDHYFNLYLLEKYKDLTVISNTVKYYLNARGLHIDYNTWKYDALPIFSNTLETSFNLKPYLYLESANSLSTLFPFNGYVIYSLMKDEMYFCQKVQYVLLNPIKVNGKYTFALQYKDYGVKTKSEIETLKKATVGMLNFHEISEIDDPIFKKYVVTIYDDEVEKNTAKRTIKVIDPIYLTQIFTEFKQILKEKTK